MRIVATGSKMVRPLLWSMANPHEELAMNQHTFQRGITFGAVACPAARALAQQVARTFGVEPSWTDGATRLVVTGPRDSVDAFFSVAQAAICLAGQPPAAA